MSDFERPSYPKPILRAWLGRACVLSAAVSLYGLAWNRPPVPDLVIHFSGLVSVACASSLKALTPLGTARRRLLSLDAERQERLRAINRRCYDPSSVLALSCGLLAFSDSYRAFVPEAWYAIGVACCAGALLASGAYLYSLRMAERRLYAEDA